MSTDRAKRSKRKEVADYTTVGLAIGLTWADARRIAKEIVLEHRRVAKWERRHS